MGRHATRPVLPPGSRWTVLRRGNPPPDYTGRHSYWLCRCKCGTEAHVNGGNLTTGMSLSCGCLVSENVTASNAVRPRQSRGAALPAAREYVAAGRPKGMLAALAERYGVSASAICHAARRARLG
jgi:hypothetical protein